MCRIGGFTNLRRDMMENKNFNKEIKFGNHIQIKRGSGSPQGAKDSFKVGELGYDLTNNDLYIRAESDMVRIGSNIVDTATANSKDLITSHGVSVIKNQIDSDISSLENEVNNLKKSLVDLILPVGTVITNASPTFDPNKVYKGTTWTRIKGRVIVGVDENDTSFNTINKTGGHKELQSHTHTGTAASNGIHTHSFTTKSGGKHKHIVPFIRNYHTNVSAYNIGIGPEQNFSKYVGISAMHTNAEYEGTATYDRDASHPQEGTGGSGNFTPQHTHKGTTDTGGSHDHTLTISNSGGGNAGNLQPYITKYVWERTA